MLKADKYFLEERIREEQDHLMRCVPKLYRKLFKLLEKMLVHGIYEEMSIDENSEK
jgi:hypothetical protein